MEQNNNTNEKCFISELNSLVEKESVDYAHQYISDKIKMITPIGYMLTPVKQALDDLYDLASRLCGCIDQVDLDEIHEWKVVSIASERDLASRFGLPPIERRVEYTVDISDESPLFKRKLEIIYGEEYRDIYYHELDYLNERLKQCLLWLNSEDDEFDWTVRSVKYEDGRITLVLDAKRKDNDTKA